MKPVELSPEQQGRIWEVYARLGLRPEQAVHLLRRMGVSITPVQASQELALARRRNTLCLVSAASLSLKISMSRNNLRRGSCHGRQDLTPGHSPFE